MGTQRIRTPFRQRLGDFRRGPLTLVVWSAAVVGVVFLLSRQVRPRAIAGIVRAFEYEVSSARAGTLDTLHVALYDDLDAGSVVATLDPSEVEAQIATAQSEIERLRADVVATSAELQREDLIQGREEEAQLRSFSVDANRLSLDLVALRVQIESDRIELQRLEFLQGRASEMYERTLGPEANIENFRLQALRVRTVVENNEVLAARTEEQLRETLARRTRYEEQRGPLGGDDAQLSALREAIVVQEKRIDEIRVVRRALAVRAPVSGRITEIYARQGQALLAGEPVVRLLAEGATEVIAYLPELAPASVEVGARVQVARVADPWTLAEALVRRVGPAIEALPARLWRDPAIPEFGRPLLIGGVAALGVLPGEAVSVRIPDQD